MDPALEEILNRPEPGSESAAPPAEAGQNSTDPGTVSPPVEEEDTLADMAGVPEDTKFDRAYVSKLRQEAAGYRTKAKQYDALESYDEADRKVWLQMAELYKTDPVAAAEYMEAIAKGVRGAAAPPAPQPGDDAPLTRAEIQALLAERDNAAELKVQTAAIEHEATTLGYTVGSRQYKYLCQVARDETGGDLKAAHEALEAEAQARYDQQIGRLAREADASPVAPAAGAGAPPSGETAAPKGFRGATQALREFLDSQQ